MKLFACREVEEAIAYASSGGIAIHLHTIIPDRATAPRCFVQAVDRGEPIAHVFCRDEAKLITLARQLGVRAIKIDRRGTVRSHIDLCSGPLWKALRMLDVADQIKLREILAKMRGNHVTD